MGDHVSHHVVSSNLSSFGVDLVTLCRQRECIHDESRNASDVSRVATLLQYDILANLRTQLLSSLIDKFIQPNLGVSERMAHSDPRQPTSPVRPGQPDPKSAHES